MLGEYLGAGASTTKLLLHLNGNSTDSSGNGNDGTTNGIDYVNGKFGQAASFNATYDYIEIQNESAFDFERNMPFTISLWSKLNSTGVEKMFLSKQSGSGYRGLAFYKDSNNKIHTQLSNTYQTNNLDVYTNNTFTDTTNFHNYIWTYNGSSKASGALIYVDGVAQTTSVAYNNLTASILNDTKVMIGNRATTYANFNGIIDEVIWENVVWTPEYIKKYYTYSKGRFGIL